MNTLSNGLKSFLIALLLIWLHAIPSFGAAQQQPTIPRTLLFHPLPILSDFDSDNKLDQATLFSDGPLKRIHIAFGKSSWSSLSFDSAVQERGGLFSGDIDDDGNIDLVWAAESGGKSVTWLGDGHGNFSIDPGRKVDLRALVGNSKTRVEDHGSSQQAQAVLLSKILIVPLGFQYNPYLSFQASLPDNQTSAASAPFLAVIKQRGPPSKSF
jgi:hypothetical protein